MTTQREEETQRQLSVARTVIRIEDVPDSWWKEEKRDFDKKLKEYAELYARALSKEVQIVTNYRRGSLIIEIDFLIALEVLLSDESVRIILKGGREFAADLAVAVTTEMTLRAASHLYAVYNRAIKGIAYTAQALIGLGILKWRSRKSSSANSEVQTLKLLTRFRNALGSAAAGDISIEARSDAMEKISKYIKQSITETQQSEHQKTLCRLMSEGLQDIPPPAKVKPKKMRDDQEVAYKKYRQAYQNAKKDIKDLCDY